MKKIAAAAALVAAIIGMHALAWAQSAPNFYYGFVPTPSQWQSYFSAKQDTLGYVPLNKGGDVMGGKLTTAPSSSSQAGFNIQAGTPPSLPQNGDVWETVDGGFYIYQANRTIGPFVAASTLSATIDSQFGSSWGSVLCRTSSGWTAVAPSTAGYVLTTNGANANCSWSAIPGVNEGATYAWTGPQTWTQGTQKMAVASSGITAGPFFNHTYVASQFGYGDWCENLDAALAAAGTNPATIIIDSSAGNSSCGGSGLITLRNKVLRFVDGSTYVLNRTIMAQSHVEIDGVGGLGGGYTDGTVIQWQGGSALIMIDFYGANFSKLDHMALDCNNVINCTALAYDSLNDPSSSLNSWTNFAIVNAQVGIQIGSALNTHPTVSECDSNFNQLGCAEMDFITIRNFQISGICSGTTSEGIHINSLNALQASTIEQGNFQCDNIGIHSIFLNSSGTTTFSHLNGGSPTGTNSTFIQNDANSVNSAVLSGVETEGSGWTYSVHDSTCPGSAVAVVWEHNQFNGAPVLIDGCELITSIGNSFNAGATATVAGTAQVISMGDVPVPGNTFAWTTSGSGKVTYLGNKPLLTVSTLPACSAANEQQSYYVSDATATTFWATPTGGGANVVRVGCDGTSWRIGG